MTNETQHYKIKNRILWIFVFCLIAYSNYVNSRQDDAICEQIELLKCRGQWMTDLTKALDENLQDVWTKTEEIETWDSFFANNPELLRPNTTNGEKVKVFIFKWPKVPE